MFYSKIHQYQKISIKVVHLQCILFVILWTVWSLPHTTALRNTCLVCGHYWGHIRYSDLEMSFSLENAGHLCSLLEFSLPGFISTCYSSQITGFCNGMNISLFGRAPLYLSFLVLDSHLV